MVDIKFLTVEEVANILKLSRRTILRLIYSKKLKEGVHIHPLLPRVMTPRELARLQSFPDSFIFKGSKKHQLVQIGNAVPPLMAKAIGIVLRKILKN